MEGEGFCLFGLLGFFLNYGRIEKKDEKQIPPSSPFLGKAGRFLILNALLQQHIHQPAYFLQLFMSVTKISQRHQLSRNRPIFPSSRCQPFSRGAHTLI